MVPFLSEKLRTERSVLALELLGAEFVVLAVVLAVCFVPRVEKFQVPAAERSSVTLGWSIVKPVTWMAREKIRGSNSRFTLNDLAFKNGPVLKDGSSEMEMFSTVTPPERMERRIFPMSTLRFKALFSEDSISGRNRFASITKGSSAATSSRTTMTPATT